MTQDSWHLACDTKGVMHDLTQLLRTLQKLNDLQSPPLAEWVDVFSPRERKVLIKSLRATLPTSLLGHHDRAISRGRRSLAEVRKGICGVCHLRLPKGHFRAKLVSELDLCDHCGAFLEWPTASRTPQAAPLSMPSKTEGRKLATR